jgi:hypothetical protein
MHPADPATHSRDKYAGCPILCSLIAKGGLFAPRANRSPSESRKSPKLLLPKYMRIESNSIWYMEKSSQYPVKSALTKIWISFLHNVRYPRTDNLIMTNLFRRASYLFWQYPILWAPVFVADILNTLLKGSQPFITRALIQTMLQSHSVLSSVPDPLHDPQSTWKVGLLSAPIIWGTHFAGIILYASAMTITANFVLMHPPVINSLYKQNPNHSFRNILFFSLKVFAIIFLVGIPSTAIVSVISMRSPRSVLLWGGEFGVLYGIAFTVVVAYLITPTAIRLLMKRRTDPVNVNLRRSARAFTVLAVIASELLSRLTMATQSRFLSQSTPRIGALSFIGATSLVSAFPYILLFIALALAANPIETEQHFGSSEPLKPIQ